MLAEKRKHCFFKRDRQSSEENKRTSCYSWKASDLTKRVESLENKVTVNDVEIEEQDSTTA